MLISFNTGNSFSTQRSDPFSALFGKKNQSLTTFFLFYIPTTEVVFSLVFVCWLVVWCVDLFESVLVCLTCWLVGWLVDWWDGGLIGGLAGWLIGGGGCLFGGLVDWWVGWLVGGLVVWWVGQQEYT